jgi:hypothetical protein
MMPMWALLAVALLLLCCYSHQCTQAAARQPNKRAARPSVRALQLLLLYVGIHDLHLCSINGIIQPRATTTAMLFL